MGNEEWGMRNGEFVCVCFWGVFVVFLTFFCKMFVV